MLGRIVFWTFFLCGGFLVVIPYWLLFGTKAQRDRKRQMKLAEQTLKAQREANRIAQSQ